MTIESKKLQHIIEGALLAAGQPLDIKRLGELFITDDPTLDDEPVSADEIRQALEAITLACEDRGFELKEVGSGWRFQVREETAPWVNRLWEEKPQKYSRAMLETLALIAYRQPITRGDIEEIRGVAVSSHIIKTLTEREWVKVVGHRDVPGRPALYATTRLFLDYFNLSSLEDLPSLGELADLDQLNPELDLNGPDSTEDDETAANDEQPGSDASDDTAAVSADDAGVLDPTEDASDSNQASLLDDADLAEPEAAKSEASDIETAADRDADQEQSVLDDDDTSAELEAEESVVAESLSIKAEGSETEDSKTESSDADSPASDTPETEVPEPEQALAAEADTELDSADATDCDKDTPDENQDSLENDLQPSAKEAQSDRPEDESDLDGAPSLFDRS